MFLRAKSRMMMDWNRCVWMLMMIVLISVVMQVKASHPADKQAHPDGSFWFGTQSLLCTTSKLIAPPPLPLQPRTKRSSSPSSYTATPPERSGLRYIHRLIYYKDTVFEWGTGVRGHHWGLAASVTDCPVTWERSPAGRGHCPIDAVVNYTRLYRTRFGPYHLLTNNCHHFANRVSALLTDPDCGGSGIGIGGADGIVSVVERSLWRFIGFVLSYVDPVERPQDRTTPDPAGYVVQ